MIQGDFDFQKMNPAVESAIGQGADAIFDGYTDVASISSIVTRGEGCRASRSSRWTAATEPTDAFAINITTDQQGIVDQTVGALDESLGGLDGKTVMVIGHDPHAGIRMRSALAEEAFDRSGRRHRRRRDPEGHVARDRPHRGARARRRLPDREPRRPRTPSGSAGTTRRSVPLRPSPRREPRRQGDRRRRHQRGDRRDRGRRRLPGDGRAALAVDPRHR